MYIFRWCCFWRGYYTFCSIFSGLCCVKWRHVCDYYTRIAADEFVSIFYYFCVIFIHLVLITSSFPLLVDASFIHESGFGRGAHQFSYVTSWSLECPWKLCSKIASLKPMYRVHWGSTANFVPFMMNAPKVVVCLQRFRLATNERSSRTLLKMERSRRVESIVLYETLKV